jgi:hypothetical protein
LDENEKARLAFAEGVVLTMLNLLAARGLGKDAAMQLLDVVERGLTSDDPSQGQTYAQLANAARANLEAQFGAGKEG